MHQYFTCIIFCLDYCSGRCTGSFTSSFLGIGAGSCGWFTLNTGNLLSVLLSFTTKGVLGRSKNWNFTRHYDTIVVLIHPFHFYQVCTLSEMFSCSVLRRNLNFTCNFLIMLVWHVSFYFSLTTYNVDADSLWIMLWQIKKGIDDRPILGFVHGLYHDLGVQDLTVQTDDAWDFLHNFVLMVITECHCLLLVKG